MSHATLPTTRLSSPPLRHLWQVPTFFLGVVALAGVWLARPLWMPSTVVCEERHLQELREALNRREIDVALARGEDALRLARDVPNLAGEAHFLVGSTHLVLAGRPPAGNEYRLKARFHLEQAAALGVSDDDRPRLDVRLGLAWAMTDHTPQLIIDRLAPALPDGADDPDEAVLAYGALTAAYLHLPQPDLAAALDASDKQLGQSSIQEVLLAPARLQRGEILLRLDRTEEAHEALKNVGSRAPPALAARARLLRIQMHEAERQWADAAALWREALDDRRSPPPDRPAVLYRLGHSLRHSEQRDEAVRFWAECVRLDAVGDEAPAAALGLAELRAGPLAPVEALGRAVRDVKTPGDWRNGLVPLESARTTFEAVARSLQEKPDWDAALQAARLYERIAGPGRAAQLRGQTAEAWARAVRANPSKPPAEASALFIQAGEAAEEAAAAPGQPAQQAEYLWLAASRYAEGKDLRRAAAAYDRFLATVIDPNVLAGGQYAERVGEAWFRLAEARRALQHEAAAVSAFRECLKWPGKYGYRARYQLALVEKSRGRLDDAQAALEHNLQLLRDARDDHDAEARERTLFALGDLYFERRDLKGELSKAIACLEAALEQFPSSPESLFARYQLAESYRLLADQLGQSLGPQERLSVEARLRIEQEVARHRERAAANYQQLSQALLARPSRDQTEDGLLVYASFTAADCRFLLGDYDVAGQMYQTLADRYRGRVEQFNALAGVVRAYSIPGGKTPERATRALADIRAGLPGLEPATRQEFEKWLKAFDR